MLGAMPTARTPSRSLCLILLVGGLAAPATEASGTNDSAAPTLILKAVKSTYHLRDAVALKSQLEAARRSQAAEQAADAAGNAPDPKAHVEYPEPPTIDLSLTVTNTSKAVLRMRRPGDDRSPLTLSLQGEGAVTVSPGHLHTMELNESAPLVLAPGKSQTVHLERLASGFRDDDRYAYWTSPGEYRVSVQWRTAIAPVGKTSPPQRPADVPDEENDWRPTTLSSNSVTITVKCP